MIKHIWSVLCQKSLIDSETNNLTLVDVLEELSINISIPPLTVGTPANSVINRIDVLISYEIVSLWVRDSAKTKETINLSIELLDPTGKGVSKQEHTVVMNENLLRYRTRLKIVGLGISTPGHYSFLVKIKEENKENYRTVAELPLEIKIIKNNPTPKTVVS